MSISQQIRRSCARLLIAVLYLSIVSPFAPEAVAVAPRLRQPLGEVRGTPQAQVSFDGKNWRSLGSGTLPVFDGTVIKAHSGVAALTLQDGSRMEASPTTELAISKSGTQTNVMMSHGNVVFRLRPSGRALLSVPGGTIQTDGRGTAMMNRAGAVASTTTPKAQGEDALGVVTAQKNQVPRIQLFSGQTLLLSKNGFVKERLRGGESRTILAQAAGPLPLKRYAQAQEGSSVLPPPTDPPDDVPKPEFVWTWHPSHAQDVRGGWQEIRLGSPPELPPRPEQELRKGFAWAWSGGQWVVARRDCEHGAAFRLPVGVSRASTLPPPTDPPPQAPKPEHVWAWHGSNVQEVWGGWQETKLGPPPQSPPRPEQELYDGFVWAWEEPTKRWVVVEECDLAAAFLWVAAPLGAYLGAAAGVGGVVGGAAVLSSSSESTPPASNSTP